MKVRPSGWWYLLVPLVFVTGIGFAVDTAIDEGRSVADSFERVGADGTATVSADAGDEITVFALFGDGRGTDEILRPDARVTIDGPGDSSVPFEPADSGQTTFDLGGDAGIDLGTFTAREDGLHRVEVEFGGGIPSKDLTAGVGRLDISSIIGAVLRPAVIGLAASLALWILLLTLRGASKRRQRSSPPVTPPGSVDNRGPFV